MANYFLLAFRNLKRRGIRSWLTLLGIFIGITAVVSLIGLGEGLKVAVNSQFGISSTETITIRAGGLAYGAPGTGVSNPLTRDDAEEIEKLRGIETVIMRNIETVKAEFNDKVIFPSIFSVESGKKRRIDYEMQEFEAIEGRLLQDEDRKKVLLGYDYSDEDRNGFNKKVKAGDKITVQNEKFRVIGILERKGSFFIDKSIIMNEEDLDDLMDVGNRADIISVKVKDKDLMDKAKEEIEKLMRRRRDVDKGEEDFQVSTPEATLETVNNVLGGIQAFIVIIASMSIIIGAIGIVNTMTASVLERKKEIGIMKAIGAKNEDIFMQFFIESGLIGLIGGIIGVVVGTSIAFLGSSAINNFIGSETSLSLNFIFIAVVLTNSFLIGGLAGIFPAMQAAKQNPVDALRK